jgi:hypothetical protein
MFTAYSVKVERMTTSGVSDTGSPIKTVSTIYANLVVDIMMQAQEILEKEGGKNVVVDTRITCPMATDIKADDVITELSSGIKYKVEAVIKRELLKYLEIKARSGVV